MSAWPLASLETCPRDPLGGAALGEVKPVGEPEEETKSSPAERMAPMRRAPGGRTRVIYVRVTEEEDREIRRRAVKTITYGDRGPVAVGTVPGHRPRGDLGVAALGQRCVR